MKIGLLSLVLAALPLAAQSNQDKLIQASADVLHDMTTSIPQNLMQKAQCVGVVPNEKRAGLFSAANTEKACWSAARRPDRRAGVRRK